MVNSNTCKEIKKTTFGNGKDVGYFVDGTFIKCEELRHYVELIAKEKLPF